MPAGRPVGTGKYKDGPVTEGTYTKTHPEQLLEYYKLGYLDCQVYSAFGVCKDTFYEWIREHPEFKRAHDIGLPMCESWWIEWGMKGMRGEIKGFNFNSWIAFMNNKFKWAKGTYGDNLASNHTTNISVQNMNILQQKGKADLIEYIQRIANKNQDILEVQFIESESIESGKPTESE